MAANQGESSGPNPYGEGTMNLSYFEKKSSEIITELSQWNCFFIFRSALLKKAKFSAKFVGSVQSLQCLPPGFYESNQNSIQFENEKQLFNRIKSEAEKLIFTYQKWNGQKIRLHESLENTVLVIKNIYTVVKHQASITYFKKDITNIIEEKALLKYMDPTEIPNDNDDEEAEKTFNIAYSNMGKKRAWNKPSPRQEADLQDVSQEWDNEIEVPADIPEPPTKQTRIIRQRKSPALDNKKSNRYALSVHKSKPMKSVTKKSIPTPTTANSYSLRSKRDNLMEDENFDVLEHEIFRTYEKIRVRRRRANSIRKPEKGKKIQNISVDLLQYSIDGESLEDIFKSKSCSRKKKLINFVSSGERKIKDFKLQYDILNKVKRTKMQSFT